MPAYTPAEIEVELARGTAPFRCENCPSTAVLSARGICAHWRAAHPGLKWNDGWPYEILFDRRKRFADWPKRTAFVKAYGSEDKLRECLEALGLSADATHEELDALVRAGRLVCGCGSPQLPPPGESSWDTLVSRASPIAVLRKIQARV